MSFDSGVHNDEMPFDMGKRYIYRGYNSFKICFCLPSIKGAYSKRKQSASCMSKFFPFRVDPFQKEIGV